MLLSGASHILQRRFEKKGSQQRGQQYVRELIDGFSHEQKQNSECYQSQCKYFQPQLHDKSHMKYHTYAMIIIKLQLRDARRDCRRQKRIFYKFVKNLTERGIERRLKEGLTRVNE